MTKKESSLIIISLLLFQICSFSQNIDSMQVLVNSFINQWHEDAANADTAYFEKISDNGIYIGTDATEYWSKAEFINWSKSYFENGRAWSFKTIERNIYFGESLTFGWFDELLETGMGVCRASGVFKNEKGNWKILHYHLSIAVPNENVNEIKKIIEKK